jgi:hypothetical protein
VNIDRMTLVATLAVVDQVGRLGHPSARGAASFVGQPLPALGLRTHLSLSILLV